MVIKKGEQMLASDILDLTFFPVGTILTFSSAAWNATSADFKKIWKICDGQNGTPNLTNKFLRGGTSSGASGDGKKVLSINEIPAHGHSITESAHNHTITETAHSHTVSTSGRHGEKNDAGHPSAAWDYGDVYHGAVSSTTASSVKTGISLSASSTGIKVNNTGGSVSFDVIPAFYTVIYIIKVK